LWCVCRVLCIVTAELTQWILVCTVVLVGVPLLLGFTVSRLLAEPFFEVAQAYNPEIFHPTALQRAEGGREVHKKCWCVQFLEVPLPEFSWGEPLLVLKSLNL
jgi:hypothetical protein